MTTPVMMNKGIKRMPSWVNEQSGRIGPKPPPPPPEEEDDVKALTPEPIRMINNQSNGNGVGNGHGSVGGASKSPKSEPDYEVIEFANQQQYSNEPMIKNKVVSKPSTPEAKLKCTLCGSNNPWVICESCSSQIFCASCDDMFHKHPKRREHVRKAVEQNRPPLPPKAAGSPMPPIAPPRRHKRGVPTPLLSRKDQMNGSSSNRSLSSTPVPSSPTPSIATSNRSVSSFNAAWSDRVNSLKRGSSIFNNRPLPDIPKPPTPQSDNASSRSTTPKSVFDNIQRPPSVTLEKIKSKASATLDRMAVLQQQYRQHKAQQAEQHLKGGFGSKDERQQLQQQHLHQHHQHQHPHPQVHPQNLPLQRPSTGSLSRRRMSTSVFNLNQVNRPVVEAQPTAWMGNMQQAQSMAQLNCANICHLPPSGFCGAPPLNSSNLSLNMPNSFARSNMQYPPPAFMNQQGIMGNMYPYPYPYAMPTQPGFLPVGAQAGYPMGSRPGSRLASPAMSRKSLSLRRKRSSYAEEDATDDEDSDDDRRSIVSNRSGMTSSSYIGQRPASTSHFGEHFDGVNPKLRNKYRNQRRPSVAKSLQGDWLPDNQANAQMHRRRNSSQFSSPPAKIYSDLDSEGSGTKALVQAKIQQKMKDNLKEKTAKKVDQATETAEIRVKSTKEKTKTREESFEPAARAESPVSSEADENENEDEDEVEHEANEKDQVNEEADRKTVKGEEEEGAVGLLEGNEEEASGLGPPPSTPDYEWTCEFCTFVNEPKVKICAICCKTPSTAALRKKSPPESILKTSNNTSHITNDLNKLQLSNGGSKDSAVPKNSDSLECIWSNLEKNIQETAIEVAAKQRRSESKSSNRSSETREVLKDSTASTDSTSTISSPTKDVPVDSQPVATKGEKGTSPPPQSISTQTYETIIVNKMAVPEKEARKSLEKQAPLEIESPKFTMEEFQIALKYSGGTMDPMQWLRENWQKLIHTVQNLSTMYGQELTENTIGTISQSEAREALKSTGGNVWQAISQCIEDRRKKFTYLSNKGHYLREDIVSALTTHQGNIEMALLDLERTNLKPFLMRIWGSPGGVENECSPLSLPKTSGPISPFEILEKKDKPLGSPSLDRVSTPPNQREAENQNEENDTDDVFEEAVSDLTPLPIEQTGEVPRETGAPLPVVEQNVEIVIPLKSFVGTAHAVESELSLKLPKTSAEEENSSSVSIMSGSRESNSVSSTTTQSGQSQVVSVVEHPSQTIENHSMAVLLNELENNIPELSTEIVLSDMKPSSIMPDSVQDGPSTSQSHRLLNETENNIPELPSEVVLQQSPGTSTAAKSENDSNPDDPSPSTSKDIKEQSLESAVSEIKTSLTKLSETLNNITTNSPETEGADRADKPSTTISTSLTATNDESPSSSGIKTPTISHDKQAIQDDQVKPKKEKLVKATETKTTKKVTEKPKAETSTKISTTQKPSKIETPSGIRKNSITKVASPEKDSPTKKANTNSNTNTSSSKIPKPSKSDASKKTLTRSRSFSVVPAPIGISSVRAIQANFLKQSSTTGPGTSARGEPVRKKSISDTINKFTKSFDKNKDDEKPSTSHGIKFRSYTRIPKKKYHETCFSDEDYGTTTDDEAPQVSTDFLTRKQSVPVFQTYPSLVEKENINVETLVSKYLEEKLVSNQAEAHLVAALVQMKFPEEVSIMAAKECNDLDQAIAFLRQECELCMEIYPMNEIVSMLKCTHKCCKRCAKQYFTVQITERSINDCSCPYCKLPELGNQKEHEDEHLEYFSNLDIFLKSILDEEVHELFQRKLRDRSLLQDPNFKWCIQCSSGFFARPKQKRLICPDCGSVTCAQCRKPWEAQHEGITCEAYLEWKEANDPELQIKGVQEHLSQNGIDCPKCKFRFSLARGGCMHFTCSQCKYEFCYGCGKPFMMGAKCTRSPYCAKLGLHAHHPRNCLFYLRDKLPLQLQFLLKEHNVAYDVEPFVIDNKSNTKTTDITASTPSTTSTASTSSGISSTTITTTVTETEIGPTSSSSMTSSQSSNNRCPIPLQKETPQGLVDTVCNNEVPDQHAGMCRLHYVEYLTSKVAKAKIDPLPIFDLTDCVQELRRRGIALPERGPWDTDEIYKKMCADVIKKNIPLESD